MIRTGNDAQAVNSPWPVSSKERKEAHFRSSGKFISHISPPVSYTIVLLCVCVCGATRRTCM